MVRERQVGTHVEQRAEGVGDVEVEIEEILPAMLFKEGSYIVGIIFEEGVSPYADTRACQWR